MSFRPIKQLNNTVNTIKIISISPENIQDVVGIIISLECIKNQRISLSNNLKEYILSVPIIITVSVPAGIHVR